MNVSVGKKTLEDPTVDIDFNKIFGLQKMSRLICWYFCHDNITMIHMVQVYIAFTEISSEHAHV